MKSYRLALAFTALLVLPAQVHAAARVFVSVSGTDTGDCSNVAAPCRTLNFAITAVDDGGEVIVLTTGSYAGATITKSVKVDVPTGVIAFSASPIAINAPGSTVVLRGLTLKALTPLTGNGVDITAADQVIIENSVIDSWHFGIVVESGATNARISVTNSELRNNFVPYDSGSGATGTVLYLTHSRLFNNTFGTQPGVGNFLFATDVDAAKGTTGLHCTGGTCFFNDVRVTDKQFGLVSGNGQIFLSRVAVTNCTTAGVTGSATSESAGNNSIRGNTLNVSGTLTVVGQQ
jgi:hypothetical protein